MADPMPLKTALAVCFPHGGITEETMLAAIRNGKLAHEKIGRRYFVTEADVREWRKGCRKDAKAQGSGSGSAKGENPAGALSTDELKLRQNMALMRLERLKKTSPDTLRKKARRSTPAPATPLRLVVPT